MTNESDPQAAPAAGGLDWQRALANREDQARELIRAHPVATLLGAAALGFTLARIVRAIW
jgi:hypothetical protein